MARTKQTQRQDVKTSTLPRAVFGVSGNASNGRKKKRAPKKKKRSFTHANQYNFDDYGDRSRFVWHNNYTPRDLAPVVIDDMGHDDLHDEALFGSLRGNVVGIRYYNGTVNNQEMVAIEREPNNQYDSNAIRILSVGGQQVGHIKRELAKPLAHIMDRGWARLEGVIPFGSSNMFSMPIDLTLWGKPELCQQTMDKLKQHGFHLTPGSAEMSLTGGSGMGMSQPQPRRTFMSPDQMKGELDKLFENLEEGDKTSTAEPAKTIITPMYTHQKQALNWMIQRENGNKLPPFWEEKCGRFFNSVTIFTTDKRPQSVRGGILADDMGLGKTLEMIALIVTNFRDGLPLAVPVPGKVRQSKLDRAKKTVQRLYSNKMVSRPMKKLTLKREQMSDFIVDDRKPSNSFAHKRMREISIPGPSSQLPSLPDDESTDSDSSDDSDDSYDLPRNSKPSMMRSEDPEFVPKSCTSKENVTPKSLRPRRDAKKPTRYVYNSDSDVLLDSPAAKGGVSKVLSSGQGSVATATTAAPNSGEYLATSNVVAQPATSSSISACTATSQGSTPSEKEDASSTGIHPSCVGGDVGVSSIEDTIDLSKGTVGISLIGDTQSGLPTNKVLFLSVTESGDTSGAIPTMKIGLPTEKIVPSVTDSGDASGAIPAMTCSVDKVLSETSVTTTSSEMPGPLASGVGGTDPQVSRITVKCLEMPVAEQEGSKEHNVIPEVDLTSLEKMEPDRKVTRTTGAKSTPKSVPVVVTPAVTSARPKRNAKKPSRYTVEERSPMKRLRVNVAGDSKASNTKGKGKRKGKAESEAMMVEIPTELSEITPEQPVKPKSRGGKAEIKTEVKVQVTEDKVHTTGNVSKVKEETDIIVLSDCSQPTDTKDVKKDFPVMLLSDDDLPDPTPDVKPKVSLKLPDPTPDVKSKVSLKLPDPTPDVKSKVSLKFGRTATVNGTNISDDQPDPSVSSSYDYTPHFSDDELPDIPDDISIRCNSPGTSLCGKLSGRTQTKGPRTTLIVAPLSVISNWHDQLEEHIHENAHLEIYTYYGSSRTKDPAVLSKQDVVLTTYSTLAADTKGKSILQKVQWLRIVLDEGHAIRNPNAQQTKAICQLRAERKWILTGTPIQNSMKDLWSLVNFLRINPFTDKQWWRRTIERPLDQNDERALKRVRHLMSSIALRRTKTQKVNDKPLVELPARNVFVEHITLSEEERKVYDAMQTEGKIIVSKYFRQGTLLHNYGEVLAILMRLRQMCCHPMLVAKAAAAVQEVLENVDAATASGDGDDGLSPEMREKLISTLLMVLGSGSDEECAICLETLKDPVITHCAHVYCHRCIEMAIKADKPKCPLCRGDIDASKLLEVPAEQLEDQSDDCSAEMTDETWKSSSKVDAVVNALARLREEDNTIRSLVVSQFTSLLSLLEIPLRAQGFRFTRLDGTMTLKQRVRAVEEFMDPSPVAPTIMLLSLKAGGVGINLTSASRVFLMDPAWNPAAEDQCFDRCHRLGQKRDVIITKFIVDDSVEVKMTELQDKKRQLMQGAFGASKKETAEQRRQNRIRDIKTLMNF